MESFFKKGLDYKPMTQLKKDYQTVVRKCLGVLKNFAMFTRKHLCWSLFLIKLQA